MDGAGRVAGNHGHAGIPHILGLPFELVEHVASFLHPTDLLSLWSTCSELRSKTEQEVSRQFFSDRTFLIADKASLQVLLQISKHPVFAKSMKTIRFSFAIFLPQAILHLERLWGESDPLDDFEETSANRVSTRDSRCRRRGLRRLHEQLIAAQARFRETHSDVEYLRHIFINFKHVGNIPAIVAGGEDFFKDEFQQRAWGYARLVKQLEDTVHRPMGVFVLDKHSFSNLNRAIGAADYPMASLELGTGGFGVCPSDLEHLSTSQAPIHLTTLRLTLTDTNTPFRRFEEPLAEASILEHFINFLSAARNLDSFFLRTRPSMHPEVHRLIFKAILTATTVTDSSASCGFRCLRVLELENLNMNFTDLIAFVHATCRSLTRLKITLPGPKRLPFDTSGEIRAAHGGSLDLVWLCSEEF